MFWFQHQWRVRNCKFVFNFFSAIYQFLSSLKQQKKKLVHKQSTLEPTSEFQIFLVFVLSQFKSNFPAMGKFYTATNSKHQA